MLWYSEFMAFGRREQPEFKPYTDEETLAIHRGNIHRSIDRLGLDPDQIMIVGGAVLNAYGIRPAHDVDVIATAQILKDIYANDKRTPSGVPVRPHIGQSYAHVVSAAPDSRHMGVDIITNFDPSRHGRDSKVYDQRLMAELKEREHKFGNFHISTPQEMLHQYETKRRGDRRAKRDKASVEAYLRSLQDKDHAA